MAGAAPTLNLAVVGAGPVGLSLALNAARALPHAAVSLFDARSADVDIARDPRTIALSLGSVQLLERLQAWDASFAQPILEVHVSQQAPSFSPFGEPELRIRAADEGVPMLGAVLGWSRALGDFGATVTIAGATPNKTETMPVAVYMNLASVQISKALGLSVLLFLIALVVLLLVRFTTERRGA